MSKRTKRKSKLLKQKFDPINGTFKADVIAIDDSNREQVWAAAGLGDIYAHFQAKARTTETNRVGNTDQLRMPLQAPLSALEPEELVQGGSADGAPLSGTQWFDVTGFTAVEDAPVVELPSALTDFITNKLSADTAAASVVVPQPSTTVHTSVGQMVPAKTLHLLRQLRSDIPFCWSAGMQSYSGDSRVAFLQVLSVLSAYGDGREVAFEWASTGEYADRFNPEAFETAWRSVNTDFNGGVPLSEAVLTLLAKCTDNNRNPAGFKSFKPVRSYQHGTDTLEYWSAGKCLAWLHDDAAHIAKLSDLRPAQVQLLLASALLRDDDDGVNRYVLALNNPRLLDAEGVSAQGCVFTAARRIAIELLRILRVSGTTTSYEQLTRVAQIQLEDLVLSMFSESSVAAVHSETILDAVRGTDIAAGTKAISGSAPVPVPVPAHSYIPPNGSGAVVDGDDDGAFPASLSGKHTSVPTRAVSPAPAPVPVPVRPLPEPPVAPALKLDLLRHLPEGSIKRYVGDVAKMCYINRSTSLLVLLSVFSGVACRVYSVSYRNNRTLPLTEYVIAGGVSGEGKSRLLETYQHPIDQVFWGMCKDWEAARADHKASGSTEPFTLPRPEQLFATDSTPEALENELEATGGYFALASAEQGVINTLVGASYGKEGRKNNNDVALKGYNGEKHRSIRASRKGFSGRVVGSIVCFAQPPVLDTILSVSEGSGLAERFLLIKEPTQLGSRDHTKEFYPNRDDETSYNNTVAEITKRAYADKQRFADLPAWSLSKEAWNLIGAFRNSFESELADGGRYSSSTMRGIAAKVDMHVMKISTLLAILYGTRFGEVPIVFVEAAIDIMRDMLAYSLGLLGEMDMVGTSAYEDSVIEYVGKKGYCTRRQFDQAKRKLKPWSEIQPSSAIGKTMKDTIDALIAKGVLTEVEERDYRGNSRGTQLRLLR